MYRFFRNLIFVACLIIFLFDCNREIDSVAPVVYDYYPLETGKYKIYKIDSTVYDEYNCSVVKSSFFIKEETGMKRLDGEGDTVFTVYRYFRKDTADTWLLLNIWTEKIEDNQLQRVENNQRIIKLVFPVKNDVFWDGIVYIRRDTLIPIRGGSIDQFKDWDEFAISDVNETFIDTVSNNIYPQAAIVTQVDKINNIEKRFSKEVFAKNIGLVYKEMWILDTQCRQNCTGVGDISTCLFTPWEDKAEKGYILTQSLIEHNY